ncbi:MAG: hypothetical protein SGPRY_006773 [Prymnesium sp.]
MSRPQSSPLPEGDVLIHCGDWSSHSSSHSEGLSFDAWLASQPHQHILIVRGNHDPPNATFPLSGAIYATRPQKCEVRGVTFDLVPYFHRGRLGSFKPTAQILVSHEPPHNVLDRCIGGKRAGTHCLRRAVERAAWSPYVWLCGHIHEAAGAERVRFGKGARATVCVNGCNANPGLAKKLVLGPLVINLQANQTVMG